jgi:hypothetical protein
VTHCSDDDLVLHYYGDAACARGVGEHLADCQACEGRLRELADALGLVDVTDVPLRDERYGLEVWQRIRHRLPDMEPVRWWTIGSWRLGPAIATGAVALVAAGFFAGRVWPPVTVSPAPAVVSDADDASNEVPRRVLLLSVADHLERSDRVLTDILNAGDGTDLSFERQWAEDLLWTGRLYRQNALDANEQSVAAVLDDLERTLLDIVHSPSDLTSAQLDEMRRRVDSAALLFKVRIMRNELQQPPPLAPAGEVSQTS